MFRLGIDVDGSKTDAILMDQDLNIVAGAKHPSTGDRISGIESALVHLLQQTDIDPREIRSVMIGTTHCYNALREENNLAKVCAIRIGQALGSIPPLFEGSESLREAMGLIYHEVAGGHEVNGQMSDQPPSRERIETFLRSIDLDRFESFAITSTFSPLNHGHEQMVADWIRETAGQEFSITLSHDLGSLGFLERENATILNAALSKVMMRALQGLDRLLHRHGIEAMIYFTQNDGTLMSYDYALRYPIRTLQSGTTNSFRGASFLTDLNNCVIVDVGKKFTHIGMLEEGFPKERWQTYRIAGVRVNLQMPEIVTLSFGAHEPVDDNMLDRIFQVIGRFQPRFEPLPIVFVGEGSAGIASRFKYPWSDVLHPRFHSYASSIGACIAPVSGQVDRMYWLDEMTREDTLEMAKKEAVQKALLAGAVPESVVVQSIKATPLAYIPSKALRVQVKAIGALS
ncbi:hydantoinase/oxoprolinase N-terminal domain-containing protein [Paenactinomyces guangxiensis]|uniref:Hydantoinase n=1 Tax=Paenactinomyces guangxiensis TaxID=1490290 RepID=A0A7W2A792_9BACL|nr:hydantoinase/oxoprolinase N-terminal domain-containing protein [Paenactinomyces guangxiensis]MBA4493310.1 hydantoinase [Paenactinomyces guangxiensis]MBH8589839.1 hydantoinase [Paenactinomyces guangxiensis]